MTEFTDQSIADTEDTRPQPCLAGREPIEVEVKANKSYWWCSCGQSKKQPFCDGSHKGSHFSPLEWVAEKNGKVAFCTCKQTPNQPLCDGTHCQFNP
ncbi:MAG: CDGSH iron-sulfur domain-containing protein [Porticoccaceae bacterium]|nr:CDGSH iron-sulfur domain-containing protein [Pseudomonadales bacterium]MCP5173131.1 CDGSH iron-sulfur domain-containing protein [Pseudomonadales bacterium]